MDTYPVNVRKQQPILPILIAVVLIVVVIAVILIPPFASARSKSREVTCTDNLKQQGLATNMYTQDWDQTFPAAGAWMGNITPFMTNADDQIGDENPDLDRFQCPQAASYYNGSAKVYGYAFDSRLARLKLEALNAHATAVMIFDSSDVFKNAADPFTSVQTPGRHYGGDVISFTDGHAKWENHGSIESIRKAMEETEPWFKPADKKSALPAGR
jgi:hypothetical protein